LQHLAFYTTAGCHLCEHAELVLQEFAALSGSPEFKVDEIDIATDEQLVELYGIRIPVVKNIGNEKEVGWPFGIAELATLF
jgi:Glutaredoxin-like domain (DUF836)